MNHRRNSSTPGPSSIPPHTSVSSAKIRRLAVSLRAIISFWENERTDITPLVSVEYTSIVAKSNRIKTLLSKGSKAASSFIVGARFSSDDNPKHIMTYCVGLDSMRESERRLMLVADIIDSQLGGTISAEHLDCIMHAKEFKFDGISKSRFADIVKECYYVNDFFLPSRDVSESIDSSSVISLYDTGYSLESLLNDIGLKRNEFSRLDDNTWLLNKNQYAKLYSRYPYLISMSLKEYGIAANKERYNRQADSLNPYITEPSNEPIIGVIDTLFSEDAYFSRWVEYHDLVSNDIPKSPEDYKHGTAISSLIVDGPALNPALDDGCGRFRVRHFGVALEKGTSSISIIKQIRRIIEANRDIKVWNLSLGSKLEVPVFSISPEAAVLDKIQTEYDVLFIIAGTNADDCSAAYPRLGSPADSLNSIIVNSSDLFGKPADYSRRGPVLEFFNKPDVSCFGGTNQDKITVWTNNGRELSAGGTSFAAPWITRKAAFLIYKMKFSREIAKALIIDSAAGWNTDTSMYNLQGFGIVPKRIEDIVRTPNDEIKFFIQGVADKFDTYAYDIPVPKRKDDFPFVAKATLVYFPECTRSQGVDYTDTELDIHIGKMKDSKIASINNNMQCEPEKLTLYEKDARSRYRKWDNVKHISERFTGRNRAKKGEKNRFDWGISIKKKNRFSETKPTSFGLVVTLKNINGDNMIDEFIRLCRGFHIWTPNIISIDSRLELYNKADTEIVFD